MYPINHSRYTPDFRFIAGDHLWHQQPQKNSSHQKLSYKIKLRSELFSSMIKKQSKMRCIYLSWFCVRILWALSQNCWKFTNCVKGANFDSESQKYLQPEFFFFKYVKISYLNSLLTNISVSFWGLTQW